MNKRYYISYGSNLSVEQMAHRCPDAKVVGMAAIRDWKLVFRVHANIEPCAGRVVPVLIWEISGKDGHDDRPRREEPAGDHGDGLPDE